MIKLHSLEQPLHIYRPQYPFVYLITITLRRVFSPAPLTIALTPLPLMYIYRYRHRTTVWIYDPILRCSI